MGVDEVGKRVRRKVLEMAFRAGRGHVGGGLSVVEVLEALFIGKERVVASEDVVVLGKGHCGEVVWGVMVEAGHLGEWELGSFGKEGTELGDHLGPSAWEKVRGSGLLAVEGGSLGHGLGVAVGLAKGKALKGEGGVVWCVVGDGEMMEGSCWEALGFAEWEGLGNLVVVVDANGLMTLEAPRVRDLGGKLRAWGCLVEEVDGQDVEKVRAALRRAALPHDGPRAVIARTVKGAGVSFMEGEARWHHGVPDAEELERALRELS